MSIQNDRWITRMAREHGMIEPFEDRQVREGVISYGVSSYGYDMRVAREFRIFTNVLNSIVDPKNFDPKSFVEFEGDVCIVPPNSFALARSVEYFRIPRDVVTLTVGKSTYARCFSADTRVALVDGTAPTLEEMARRAETGELFWGYSVGENGRIIVALLDAPRVIGKDNLIELELDSGACIRCTPDHKFILRDGRWRAAEELRQGDSMMPLYRKVERGYEYLRQVLTGNWQTTHWLSDEWSIRNGIYADIPDSHRHHIDRNRRNNAPWNLTRMPARDHRRLHRGAQFDPISHGLAIRAALAQRAQSEGWRRHFSTVQGARAIALWHTEAYSKARELVLRRQAESWTAERRALKSEQMRRYFEDPERRATRGDRSRAAWAHAPEERRAAQREIARGLNLRPEITEDAVREALAAAGTIRGAARLLDCDRSVFRRFGHLFSDRRPQASPNNHKIASARRLRGEHDVYCLTVPEAGNFALEAGLFAQNCGIITNVTPFEPEWEGYVTLEISNTTPLPAKIYANEGIAQVLFFRGEPPEVSYGDKKGKYQKQHGVTLPRL